MWAAIAKPGGENGSVIIYLHTLYTSNRSCIIYIYIYPIMHSIYKTFISLYKYSFNWGSFLHCV